MEENKDGLEDISQALKDIYDTIPATNGCMDHINKPSDEGGCNAWCCRVQNPQVLYCEFINSWNTMKQKFGAETMLSVVRSAIVNYLDNGVQKGCIFFDKDTNHCIQHKTRPLACFTPDTLVMTDNGGTPISDIAAGDLVYGADGRLHKVISTMSRIHQGVVCAVRPQGTHLKVWCTPDHRWWVCSQKDKRSIPKPEWQRADALVPKRGKQEGTYLTYPRQWHKEDTGGCLFFHAPAIVSGEICGERLIPWTSGRLFEGKILQSIPIDWEVDDEFLFMIGLYLAEGGSTSQSATFSMHRDERQHLERVSSYLNKLEIRHHWTQKRNTICLRVDSCMFSRLMKHWCGADAAHKRISKELFSQLTSEQLWKIFEAWDVGDGRTTPVGSVVYSVVTISRVLAAQMQQVLLMRGIYPRVSAEPRSNRGYTPYSIIVNESSMPGWDPVKGQGSKAMYDNEFVYYPCSDISIKDYVGPVYDIEVEDAHSFVTTAGIVHNCRTYGIMPEEEWKPRIERLKVLHPDQPWKDQCDLVTTKNGQVVTKADTDNWFKKIVEVEKTLGVPESKINDSPSGTYRTYHDHIMLMFYGHNKEILVQLSKMRVHASQQAKDAFVDTVIAQLRKSSEGGNQGGTKADNNTGEKEVSGDATGGTA